MFVYLIEQNVNEGYDTFSSAVVVARSKEEASKMHPDASYTWNGSGWQSGVWFSDGSWANPEDVSVTLIGVADSSFDKPKVILASFKAG
jgi:hypothetical protein